MAQFQILYCLLKLGGIYLMGLKKNGIVYSKDIWSGVLINILNQLSNQHLDDSHLAFD